MSKPIEAKIECPFYIDEKANTITCEGLFGNSVCIHKFNTVFEKKKHLNLFCSYNHGRKCPHYRTLSILYERKSDENA